MAGEVGLLPRFTLNLALQVCRRWCWGAVAMQILVVWGSLDHQVTKHFDIDLQGPFMISWGPMKKKYHCTI